MSEQHDFNAGGLIPGDSVRMTLSPDECVISSLTYGCVRSDHQHDPGEAEQRRARVAMTLEFFRKQHEGDAQRE